MSKTLKGIASSLAAALVIASAALAGAEKMPLDGATFEGTMTEAGKSKADKDTFVFKDGKFRSTACDAYGFTETPYTAAVSDVDTRFEAVATSPKEGTMKWKGTVKGNMIEGTADWVKKGPAEMHDAFTGKMKD